MTRRGCEARRSKRLTEAIALGGQAVPQILEGMRVRQS